MLEQLLRKKPSLVREKVKASLGKSSIMNPLKGMTVPKPESA